MSEDDKPMANATDQPDPSPPSTPSHSKSASPSSAKSTRYPLNPHSAMFTSAKRPQNIVLLMSHTAQALGALGPQPASVPQAAQLSTFKSSMDGLLETLHEVDVHMKRQILGLEEAGIIRLSQRTNPDAPAAGASQPPALTASQTAPGAPPRAEVATVRASLEPNGVGSIGALDVGWLNSRNSKVERDMEAELWEGMKQSLEDYEKAEAKQTKPEGQGS